MLASKVSLRRSNSKLASFLGAFGERADGIGRGAPFCFGRPESPISISTVRYKSYVLCY
jgi:hypothetical protein